MANGLPKFATYYGPRDPTLGALDHFEPSQTQQAHLEETDINFIMKRYTTEGLLPQGTTKTAVYGDFSLVDDYLEAQRVIQQAQDQFDELPATTRARFQNDPTELLAFVADPANLPEAKKLGMLKEQEPPPPPQPPPPPVKP